MLDTTQKSSIVINAVIGTIVMNGIRHLSRYGRLMISSITRVQRSSLRENLRHGYFGTAITKTTFYLVLADYLIRATYIRDICQLLTISFPLLRLVNNGR